MILTETDLMLDDTGQPVLLASGEEALAGGLDCFLQDIRLEALTMEGECFFDSDYGWSLLDFCHREIGELEELQIKNRVTEKLRKRDEINPHSIGVGVSRMGDDIVNIHVGFKIANEDVSYQMDLELDGAEVKLVD